MQRLHRYPIDVVAVAVVYWVVGTLSLEVALIGGVVSPLWPAVGIALAALIIFGRRVWIGIAAGALLVNLPHVSPPTAVSLAAGNTLAPVVGAELLRLLGFRKELDRIRDALAIVAVGVASMAVSATVGATSLRAAGSIPPDQLAGTWSVWWAGDVTGALLFAPLLLSFFGAGRREEEPPAGHLAEAVILGLGLVATSTFVFSKTPPSTSLVFLLFPFLAWAAVRFGRRGGCVATLVAAGFATWAAAVGFGPFAGADLHFRMLSLQAFAAAAVLTTLMLATAVAERTQAALALRRASQGLEERTQALVVANERLAGEVEARRRDQEAAEANERQLANAERLAQTGSWEWDMESQTVRWSDQMYRIYGHEPQSFPVLFGGGTTRQTVPEDRERVARDLAARLADPTAEQPPFEYRIVRSDGEERVLVGKGSVVTNADGKPVRMVGSIQDVTDARRAEDARRRAEEQFTQFFNLSLDLMVVAGFDGYIKRVNPAFERLYGWKVEELVGRPFLELVHPDEVQCIVDQMGVMATGATTVDVEVRSQCKDGTWRWCLWSAAPALEQGVIYAVGVDITDRKRAEELLQESEERYRRLVEHAPEAIVVLDLDAGHFVDANAEAERLFGMPREALYRLGPGEVSPPFQPDGRPSRDEVLLRYAEALRGETPQFEWIHCDGEGREILCEVRLLHLPAEHRRLVRGSLIDITERRRVEKALEDTAERERGLRLQQEIAQTLQDSLLPDRLPEVPGLRLAVRYRPGSAGLEVGGDWYDVFPLPGGAVALAVGDIVGRGLKAAATMGQLRTALRAYALEGLSPATTLERLGGLAQTLPEAEMATLVYAVYQPDAGVLSFVSAGHPPPLLVRSDGSSAFLEEGRSSPLGVTGYPASEAMVALEPGSILLLYTDGLVERRGRALDEGLATLAEVAAGRADDDPEKVCDAVMELMADEGGPHDDVALMVLSLEARHAERFRFSAAAEPQHLAPLRRALARWLSEAGATKEETDDIVLAISEAAANAVLHAYGPADGTFEIVATAVAGVVEAVVRDRGRWRNRGPEQGGRGIRLMRALVDSADLVSGASGTEVRLRRRLACALGGPVAEHPAAQAAESRVAGWPMGPEGSDGDTDGVAVVRVTEEMDFSNAEPMGVELARAVSSEHLGLVLDLSEVTLLDSSGLRLLFRLGRRLERRRQQLRVVVPTGSPVRRVLDVAGIWTGSHLAGSVEEAVASIREHPIR